MAEPLNVRKGTQGFVTRTLGSGSRASAPPPTEPTAVETFELPGDDRSLEVIGYPDGRFGVTFWDDGIGLEVGGDIFGCDGTRWDSLADATTKAKAMRDRAWQRD